MDTDNTRMGWRRPKGSGYPPDAEDAAYAADAAIREEAPGDAAESGQFRASLAAQRLERWLADLERLRLAEYVRYVDDRKRLFWSSFIGGVARGVGMAVGFTILGAVLVLILQDLAKHNLPVIGDFLAQIVSVVQKRLE